MELFDTHAHYNDEKFDNDRKQVIQDIYNSNVTMLINAGYSVESSIKGVEIAKDYDDKVKFVKVNVENCINIAKEYSISGLPSLLVFKQGEAVERMTGLMPKSTIISNLEKHI